MSQQTESPAELHTDHRHWQSGISMWQFDVQQWKAEHSNALKEIEQISKMIQSHEQALNKHLNSLSAIETSLEYHEKNLAASLRTGTESLDDTLLDCHREEADKVCKLGEAHERIKRHHHVAMAHVASLKNALEAAM